MSLNKDPREIAEEMAQTIVALTHMQGDCSRLDLVKAGFTAQELGDHYAMAAAIADLLLKRHPKNH